MNRTKKINENQWTVAIYWSYDDARWSITYPLGESYCAIFRQSCL